MYKYLLTSKEQKKLQLFEYILFSMKGRTLREIEDNLYIKSHTARRYIKELSLNIKEIFSDNIVKIKQDKSNFEVIITGRITRSSLLYILQNFYIKSNPLSKTLFYLLSNSSSSIIELSQALNYSESAMYKIKKELSSVLNEFNIELELAPMQTTKFVGDEFSIRCFLYISIFKLYHNGNKNILIEQVPYEFTDEKFIEKGLGLHRSLSEDESQQLLLMASITAYRLVYVKKSINLPKQFFEDSKYFYNGEGLLNLKSFNVSNTILDNESQVISFLSHFIPNLYSYKEKERIVNKYLNSHMDIGVETDTFLYKFQQKLNISFDDSLYIEIFYIILIYVIRLNYLKVGNDSFHPNPLKLDDSVMQIKDNSEYKRLEDIMKELAKELPLNFSLKKEEEKKISLFLYNIYEMGRRDFPVKIYINHDDVADVLYIKQRLIKIYNSNLIEFKSDSEEADILILNLYESNEDKPMFIFNNIHDTNTWIQLLKYLSKNIFFER